LSQDQLQKLWFDYGDLTGEHNKQKIVFVLPVCGIKG
jgi:hypothetical protein